MVIGVKLVEKEMDAELTEIIANIEQIAYQSA